MLRFLLQEFLYYYSGSKQFLPLRIKMLCNHLNIRERKNEQLVHDFATVSIQLEKGIIKLLESKNLISQKE